MKYTSLAGLEAMAWTLTSVAVLLTLGRFIIHWKTRKHITLCDILNGVAAGFLIAFTATFQSFFPGPYNAALYILRTGDSDPSRRPYFDLKYEIRMNLVNSIFFWCCIYTVKASFLSMYWAIFNRDATFKRWWKGAVVYIAFAFVVGIIALLTHCGSPARLFDRLVCLNHMQARMLGLQVTWCVVDGIGDIILTILPLMMLKDVFVCRSQKIQLAVIFSLVGLNLATNILRTAFTADRDLKKSPYLNTVWSLLQINSAVIICALPCYGSQLTRKKQKKQDGLRVVGGSDSSAQNAKPGSVPCYSLESVSAIGDTKQDTDTVVPPSQALHSIKVRDDVKNADNMFSPGEDRRVRHSVTIWH